MEYRVLVQGSDYLGFDFIENIITVAKQGAELDKDQLRMAFPAHAVLFLETDEKVESTATITYTPLSAQYKTEKDLESLSLAEFRNEMQKVGIKSRNRSDATTEYLAKFGETEDKKVEPEEEKPARKSKKADSEVKE